MNCNAIAPWYRLFEYSTFGVALQRRRCHFLPALTASRRMLMLGEGDGRFLQKLLNTNSCVEVDYVDKSSRMLDLAAQRVDSCARVHFHQSDITSDGVPGKEYDAVVTHFFLDCLLPEEINCLIENVRNCVTDGACWVVSEFHIPDDGWQRVRAQAWLRILYASFGLATGLRAAQLPDYKTALVNAEFRLHEESTANLGLLTSQLWVRG
ncbi:MAG TPA: class I SAM-dependent methyltransferase [Terriglobales bacterium]|nr:class I SAM-dependent methyltransferase [Terriglobales bacterium]